MPQSFQTKIIKIKIVIWNVLIQGQPHPCRLYPETPFYHIVVEEKLYEFYNHVLSRYCIIPYKVRLPRKYLKLN